MREVIYIEDIRHNSELRKVVEFCCNGDKHIEAEDKFQYFVTAHFSKSKQIDAEHCLKHFRNVLDKKVYGSRRRLYKACFVEEGKNNTSASYNKRHAHILIEKPKHLTKAQFEKQFNSLWEDICGSDNIRWKRITNKEGGVLGLVNYCIKEIDFGNKAFIEELSDNSSLQNNRETRHSIMAKHYGIHTSSNY